MEFSSSAPKCQDAFRSLFPKAIPSVHIPMRQHTSMETVTRESIHILSYVNWFLKAIGKTSTLMEDLLQQGGFEGCKDKLLSHLQMQSACLNSLDKALEAVTDLSIALACNLQLARRDSILKVCASHLQEHDFNKLRRTGFKSADLFCPTTLDQNQKKQDRSPKRLKGEQRTSFQSNSCSDDRCSSSHSSGKFFLGQQDKYNKKPYQLSASRRGGSRRK